jgi:ferredoxin
MSSERGSCELTVCLDGEKTTAVWRQGTVLLDALHDAGVDAPFSCREGSCCVCVCRLVRGQVSMPEKHALDPTDIADGYILACQAVSDSATAYVTYDD